MSVVNGVYTGFSLPPVISNRYAKRSLSPIVNKVSFAHNNTLSTHTQTNHFSVSGSARSPARKSVRREDRSNSADRLPFSSSLLIARSAVGAVNSAVTRCLSATLQKFASSGVPTGLPSYNTVVQPSRSGPYTEKLCPTTQPTSLYRDRQSN